MAFFAEQFDQSSLQQLATSVAHAVCGIRFPTYLTSPALTGKWTVKTQKQANLMQGWKCDSKVLPPSSPGDI